MPKNKVYNTGETDIELKNKYNYEGSELRKVQVRMIDMLSFLNDICKENNITYFIAFGTLLGAIRHGGFIPWDDNLYIYIYINDKGLKKLRKII
ncbi:TPA: LicD family protein, partial [Streptococcus pneumoniae]